MKKWFLFSLILFISLNVFGQDKFWIRDGDEILFWGDSITDDGIYSRIVENYVLTYYPDWNVKFVNLGWGGDRSSFYPRLERDIALSKPDRVTIMLGMNDGLYQAPDAEVQQTYVDGIHTLIKILKERSNPEILLISPTPYDLRCRVDLANGFTTRLKDMSRAFYPPTLRRLTKALQEIADKEGCRYYDLHQDYIERIEELDGFSGDYQLTAEGIHPNIDGAVYMGLGILDAMQASKDVAGVWFDEAGQVDSTYDCKISDLKTDDKSISFTRDAQRLPMPLYPSVRETFLKLIDYKNAWNRDMLAVAGKDSATWFELRIDGVLVDMVTGYELGNGVNLSTYMASPIMEQAYRVFEATERYEDTFYAMWRYNLLKGVRGPNEYTPFDETVDTKPFYDKLDEIYKEQHTINQPKSHKIEIKAVDVPIFKNIAKAEICTEFLQDFNKLHFEIDSKLLRTFNSPLCLYGNFTYTPQYQWTILETKGYYTDVPAEMYDDGTHGDKKAGDGVYSLDMYIQKDAGTLQFAVQDGIYLKEFWNRLEAENHRDAECDWLTIAWGKLDSTLNERGTRIEVKSNAPQSFIWDKDQFEKAVKAGL